MTLPLALGLLWAGVVVLWGWRKRPRQVRSPSPVPKRAGSSTTATAFGLAAAIVVAVAVHPVVGIAIGHTALPVASTVLAASAVPKSPMDAIRPPCKPRSAR